MLTHGANENCPEVKAGNWTRCLGHDDTMPKKNEWEFYAMFPNILDARLAEKILRDKLYDVRIKPRMKGKVFWHAVEYRKYVELTEYEIDPRD